jgi:SAM-dependent methyltransferase
MSSLDFLYNLVPYSVRPFRLFSYNSLFGGFDYDHYRAVQNVGNQKKIANVWAMEGNIRFLSSYIERSVGTPAFGICHGTRRGMEQKWFKTYLGCPVIGTEIADTATQFPDTVQHDFHEERPEWVGAADFVYSNSLDHAYDPAKALRVWMRSLKPGGICILEHSSHHEKSTKLDPFAAPLWAMPYLVLDWSKGDFFVAEIIDAPEMRVSKKMTYLKFLILRNRTEAPDGK